MLALVGGMASLAGVGCVTQVYYGVQVACETDADCEAKHGSGWYCEDHLSCQPPPDAGTPDSGH